MNRAPSTGGRDDQPRFRRELGLWSSVMVVVGSMIGSGIFIVSADIARNVGSPGWLLIVWVVTGLVTLAAALSYGELAGMMPHAGGQYVYLREAYNPLIGFLYGWTLFLVIQSGTIAAVAVAFAKFTSVFVPWFGEANVLFTAAGKNVTGAHLLAVLSVWVLTAVNLRGIREGKIVQVLFTVLKIVVVLGLIVAGLIVAADTDTFARNAERFWDAHRVVMRNDGSVVIEALSGPLLIAAVGVAMVGSLFSSDAWNNITFTAAEVIEPRKTIPLSLAIGTGLVSVLYILANVAYLHLLPLQGSPHAGDVIGRGIQFATSDRVGTAAARVVLGETAEYVMAALVMISTFGCNNGLILAGARVSFAMARDGLFFRTVGKLNSRSVPGAALVLQAVWTSLLCVSGTYSDLLDYVIFAVLIFYILTIGGLFILRRKEPDAERPYRAFGYPVVPALYIAVAFAVSLDLLVFKPAYTWPGLLIVLLGIPAFFAWRRFRKTSEIPA
ncbi:MAG: amino acid permease [Bacteroidota bacterium]|nr:amino acid permease [Bacteroidota bacterium]